jgi:peptide/nickel transport system ATP-binding protein
MKDGEVVEEGPAHEVFGAPRSAYTKALLASVPGRSWTPPVFPPEPAAASGM